jgi:hypothetical protein
VLDDETSRPEKVNQDAESALQPPDKEKVKELKDLLEDNDPAAVELISDLLEANPSEPYRSTLIKIEAALEQYDFELAIEEFHHLPK